MTSRRRHSFPRSRPCPRYGPGLRYRVRCRGLITTLSVVVLTERMMSTMLRNTRSTACDE
ncbi:hypothetical protein ACFPM0_18625 [Pseudonocardia sulfidoxydans]|uniref:hypothetical protein n=1 Tax=Pseudonocardia sulfidoxydans TaxID=54011 RepID=UPI00361EEAC6